MKAHLFSSKWGGALVALPFSQISKCIARAAKRRPYRHRKTKSAGIYGQKMQVSAGNAMCSAI